MSRPHPQGSHSQRFDWRAVQVSVRLPAYYWVLAMVIVTLFGYPGVVGVTPGGWLLSLPVGKRCVAESRSPTRSRRLWEAAAAGALLGLLQGIVFAAGLLTTPALPAADRAHMVSLSFAVAAAGAAVSALLSAGIGAAFNQR